MKVLYLVSGIGPASWGTTFIQDTIFSLSQKGIEATIITPIYSHHQSWHQWAKDQARLYPNLKIVAVKTPPWITKRYLLHLAVTPILVTLKAIPLLKKEKFDLIHEFSSTPIILLRAPLFKLFFKTPIILTWSVCNNTPLGKPVWIKLFDFADLYLISSQELLKKVCSLGVPPNKLIYSPPGINFSALKTNLSGPAARKKINLPPDKFIFTYFGPLTKEKGILDLAQAIRSTKTKAVFLVWAAPPKITQTHQKLMTQIKNLKLKNLIIKEGIINIPTLLTASDCIILPQQTGHGTTIPPISVLEALYFKKPTIATNIIGTNELQSNNLALVPPQNPKSLTNAINSVYRQKPPKASSNLKNFSLQKSVDLHLNVYQSLLG